jgi:hypothetical protein
MRNRLPLGATFVALVVAPLASCGDVSKPPAPRLIAGGGVGDGAIAGTLNVYVTDDDTRAPVSSAAIRVGASADPSPCMNTTDSTGLAVFDPKSCPSLKGPVTLTVSATGYAPSTWIGADGANVTVPIRQTSRPPVDTAVVTGTIAGWETIPAPAANHQTIALIAASQSPDLGDRANNIDQGKRTIDVGGGLTTTDIAANVCVRNAAPVLSVDDCNWRLTTRTGAQAHFAVIIDNDTKGTTDNSDDTNTVIAWAVKTNLAFSAGDTASGETLEMIADADMQAFTASFAAAPAGMSYLASYPMIDLGASGRIPIILPVLDATHTASRIPAATGTLAGATVDLLAQAATAKGQAEPATLSWQHGVNAAATVAVSSWLPPPASLSAAGGTFSFAPVAGATLHGAELQNAAGDRVWSVTILDGSTSFTLPGLTPDPIPLGTVNYVVSALQIPGITLTNVSFDDAKALITGISSDQITFTH